MRDSGIAHLCVHACAHLWGRGRIIESSSQLAAIARLYYLEDMSQAEIASIYHISRSTVSRMLSAARERGIVRISVDDFQPRHHELEESLQHTFGLTRAIVVRASASHRLATRRTVAHYAASEVHSWLHDVHRIGVTGGRTLGELVRAFSLHTNTADCSVFQLMGNVATTTGVNEAGEIARALGIRLSGSVHTLNTPAIVEDAAVRASFASHEHVRAMWHMFERLQMAFVGVGSIEDSMFAEHGVLTKPMRASLRRAGAVAELCGRYFDAHGREIDHPMQERVLSIDVPVLSTVPDVVVVTSGDNKGEAPRAVLPVGFGSAVVGGDSCACAGLGEWAPLPATV